MRDPTRWRAPNGTADPEARALLSRNRAPVPSADEANRIWTNIEKGLHLSPGAPQVPHALPAASTAGTSALAGKAVLAVVLAAAAGAGLYRFHAHDRRARVDRPSPSAPVAAAQSPGSVIGTQLPSATKQASMASPSAGEPVATPAAVSRIPEPATRAAVKTRAGRLGMERASRTKPAERPAPESPPSSPPTVGFERTTETQAETPDVASSWGPTPFSSPTPTAKSRPLVKISGPEEPLLANQLVEESRQLARARAALRGHDPDRALQLLKVAVFPTAALAQEREALTIEALAAKPSLRAQAVARARAFMAAYPQSPYRARIRALTAQGE